MTDEQLIDAARAARERAHAPYSRVRVGAAVLDAGGHVHLGANVENASLGLTLCAERVALGAAVAAGALERGITRVAVASKLGLRPCGACRQCILELAPEATVLVAAATGAPRTFKATDLLPAAFTAFEPD